MKGESILYLLVEGKTDAAILSTVLDTANYRSVKYIVTHGAETMASHARTLRLMVGKEDKILIVFDSDTLNSDVANQKVQSMRYLSKANESYVKIGVFCFTPTIDILYDSKIAKNDIQSLGVYVRSHLADIKENQTIKGIQAFIDNV